MTALLLAASLLQAPGDPPLPPTLAAEEPAADEIHFTFMPALRVGGWFMGSFEASTPLGGRKIESSLFFDAGIDLRAEYGGWSLALAADYGVSSDVTAIVGGILFGKCWRLGDTPHFIQVAAGPLFGKLDVDVSAFGDFKSAVGGVVRISTTVEVHESIEVMLWADYRQLTFDYDEPVVSGDKDAGGATFAFGAGFLLRF